MHHRAFHRSRLAVLLVLAAALLALAGCGDDGPSEAEYEAGLGRVQRYLDDAAEASRATGSTSDPEQRRAKLGEAYEAIDAAADEAEGLEPPDDAADAHEDFTAALRDYAELFDALARLKANDPKETELYSQAGEIADRLDRASKDLEQAGISVEDEGE